jgi:hypothetical protein
MLQCASKRACGRRTCGRAALSQARSRDVREVRGAREVRDVREVDAEAVDPAKVLDCARPP